MVNTVQSKNSERIVACKKTKRGYNQTVFIHVKPEISYSKSLNRPLYSIWGHYYYELGSHFRGLFQNLGTVLDS